MRIDVYCILRLEARRWIGDEAVSRVRGLAGLGNAGEAGQGEKSILMADVSMVSGPRVSISLGRTALSDECRMDGIALERCRLGSRGQHHPLDPLSSPRGARAAPSSTKASPGAKRDESRAKVEGGGARSCQEAGSGLAWPFSVQRNAPHDYCAT